MKWDLGLGGNKLRECMQSRCAAIKAMFVGWAHSKVRGKAVPKMNIMGHYCKGIGSTNLYRFNVMPLRPQGFFILARKEQQQGTLVA